MAVALLAIPAGAAGGWIAGLLVPTPVLAWRAYWSLRENLIARLGGRFRTS